jgi:beta-lactam-binding protein with PASTA domain
MGFNPAAFDETAFDSVAFDFGEAEDVVVPDVVGDDEATGTASLEGAGFVVSVQTSYSDTVAAGDIISQNPAGGATAAAGSTVIIVVSLGEAPEFASGAGRKRDARRRGMLTLIGGRG